MSVREYVGARYVPVFASPIEWNSANTYEPLTIVLHQGNSFTSRQAVPTGIDIANTAYWVQTGNYNAQIEQCRQDIVAVNNRFPVSIADGGTGATGAAGARTNLDAAQADGATNTLYDAEQAISANAANIISLQDSVAYSTGGITFTPASGITINSYGSKHCGRLHMFSLDCRSSAARAAGTVVLGSVTGNAASVLGVARVMAVGAKPYEGIAQIAPESGGSREVRVFSSVENSNSYYLQAIWIE